MLEIHTNYAADPIKLNNGILCSIITDSRFTDKTKMRPKDWALSFDANLGPMDSFSNPELVKLNWSMASVDDYNYKTDELHPPIPPTIGIQHNAFASLDESTPLKTQINTIFEPILKKTLEKYQSMSPEEREKALQHVAGRLRHIEWTSIASGQPTREIKSYEITGKDIASMLDAGSRLDLSNVTTVKGFDKSLPMGSSKTLKEINASLIDPSQKMIAKLNLWAHASIALLGSQIFTQPLLNAMNRVDNIGDRYPEALRTFIRSKHVGSEDHTHFIKEYWNQKCE
jgi:hypothetical protein